MEYKITFLAPPTNSFDQSEAGTSDDVTEPMDQSEGGTSTQTLSAVSDWSETPVNQIQKNLAGKK